MRIGPLRDRVRIETPGHGRDALNAPRRAWIPLFEAPAQIETLSGREYFTGTREEAADTVRIVMRFPAKDTPLLADARAVDVRRGIVYAINSVLFDARRTMLTLACTTGVADG